MQQILRKIIVLDRLCKVTRISSFSILRLVTLRAAGKGGEPVAAATGDAADQLPGTGEATGGQRSFHPAAAGAFLLERSLTAHWLLLDVGQTAADVENRHYKPVQHLHVCDLSVVLVQ